MVDFKNKSKGSGFITEHSGFRSLFCKCSDFLTAFCKRKKKTKNRQQNKETMHVCSEAKGVVV